MYRDLTAACGAILQRKESAAGLMQASIEAAAAPAHRHAFIRGSAEVGAATAESVDRMHDAGGPLPVLAGLAVSIKDLFDVAGEVTAAGSLVLTDRPAATHDCPAVARLRRAGAALAGRNNMSEFAFSGVGVNPHYGTPANAAAALLDPVPRVPGGSTSGGAVSVAVGAAWAALGSDTGGSIRIPAALHGLVGFKNTARLTPAEGAVPLSTTLDTVSAITRSVRDAIVLHELLADRHVQPFLKPLSALRLAVPTRVMLDTLEPAVAAAFDAALGLLRQAGAHVEEIALAELDQVAAINAGGGFSAAESWAWHRRHLERESGRYDPRVAVRIRRGQAMSAAEYIELGRARKAWIASMQTKMQGFDAMLSPTVPCVAPPLAPLLVDDAAFFAVNGLLLRNPSIVNLLDGCALSLPCQRDGELPVGLMVWSGALCDDAVLGISLAIENALDLAGRRA